MATGSLIAVSRISIHAPARGATIDVEIHTVATKDFNPRPREGGDLPDAEVSFLTGISIHAPARGATFADQFLWYCCVYFNPRPREGGDLAFYPSFPLKKYFNPRPREGGDNEAAEIRYIHITFQSTPPRGGRRAGSPVMTSSRVIFQSTPPRGGRPPDGSAPCPRTGYFNPRPREGGDLESLEAFRLRLLFQSTPPRGGRLSSVSFAATFCLFQSTPPRGGRPSPPASVYSPSANFNPRPREGGDTVWSSSM